MLRRGGSTRPSPRCARISPPPATTSSTAAAPTRRRSSRPRAALATDEALLGPARRAIAEAHHNAARAVHDASEAVAAQYEGLDDAYLRERAADVRDVGRRVMRALLGGRRAPRSADGAVLVTDELLPGDAAALDPDTVAGVATAHGGRRATRRSSPARSACRPSSGWARRCWPCPRARRSCSTGTRAPSASTPTRPPPSVTGRRPRPPTSDTRSPCGTPPSRPSRRTGRPSTSSRNLGDIDGAPAAVEQGAEGVGLLRTEFLFLDRDELPDEDEQAEAYATVARGLGGRPLIIRTLDVGADKPLRALPQEPEANPFLGRRGIRLQLARPDLLAAQLRAVLRTAAEHPVKVMFPMVATIGEVRAARAALDEARRALGIDPPLEVGVMVEVPAVAVDAERFARELDFLSIGTNDLAQYTMAAERGNEHVAALAAGPVPALLRLVDLTVRGAQAHGRWVGVCGELAGDVDGARLLAGLGVSELSMAPPRIADVKQTLRELDLERARDAARRALDADSPDEHERSRRSSRDDNL